MSADDPGEALMPLFLQLATPPRASFSLADGRPLPAHLRAFDTLLRLRWTRRASVPLAVRAVLGRLPRLLAQYSDGRAFEVPEGDRMYGWVFIDGEWESEETAVVDALLEPGEFSIDVGANHGWFSLVMSRAVGTDGVVWAVEPVPRMVEALTTTLSRNGATNVRVLDIALGARFGIATIYLFDGLPPGHASESTLGRGDHRSLRVSRQTLDDLLAEQACRPTLIKLDVEGAELSVLRGARRTLTEATPALLVEVNYETASASGFAPADLLDLAASCGRYRFFRCAAGALAEETAPGSAPQGASWLCLPPRLLGRLPWASSPAVPAASRRSRLRMRR